MAAEERLGQPTDRSDLLAHDIYYQSQQAPSLPEVPLRDRSPEIAAQQMLQTVIQEMGYLRANLMQPLQADLENLRQQREYLIQEIRQLEAQRQNYDLQPQIMQQQMIADFLQRLKGQIQETISQQVAQPMSGMGSPSLSAGANSMLVGTASTVGTPAVSSYQALEQLQVAQARLDQYLINLDSTLRVVFDSLQSNIHAYQASLSQGLDKMHTMGQQGETMFAALISHLAQQVGREASSLFQTTAPVAGLQPVAEPTDAIAPTSAQSSSAPATSKESADLAFPYAGVELSQEDKRKETESPLISPLLPTAVDAAIDSWLRSARTSGRGVDDLTAADLNLPDLDLSDLDLNQVTPEEIETLLSMDTSAAESGLFTSASSIPAEPALPQLDHDTTTDIDGALQLLEQLTAELQQKSPGTTDVETRIDAALRSTPPEIGDTSVISGDARDELDEFYDSLFGTDEITGTDAIAAALAADSPQEPEVITSDTATDLSLGWDLLDQTFDLPAEPIASPSEAVSSTLIAETHSPSDVKESAIDQVELLTDLFAGYDDWGDQEPMATLGDPTVPVQPEIPHGTTTPPVAAIASNLAESSPDDPYIPASPEEDLLPEQQSDLPASLGLWLDETTLTHLNEDLSSLEQGLAAELIVPGVEPAEPIASVDIPSSLQQSPLEPDDDAVLDNIGMAMPATEPSASTSQGSSAQSLADIDTLTLEGMDDLFGNFSAGSGTTSAGADELAATPDQSGTIPESPLVFTLEDMDTLFADLSPIEVMSVPPPGSSSPDQPPVFTLEGMDDLFSDISLAEVTSVPPPSSAPDSLSQNPSDSFTTEGIEEFFATTLGAESTPPGQATAPIAPSDASAPPTDVLSMSLAGDLSAFEVKQVDHLFVEVPVANSATLESADAIASFLATDLAPPGNVPTLAFTLECLDDVFTEVPSSEPFLPQATIAPEPKQADPELTLDQAVERVPPQETLVSDSSDTLSISLAGELNAFEVKQVDHLFVEVPVADSAALEPADAIASFLATDLAPPGNVPALAFTLECLDDVFTEVLSSEPFLPQPLTAPEPKQADPELTLDQALEGVPPQETPLSGSSGSDIQDSEKKKEPT
jgi:hypothetical protein